MFLSRNKKNNAYPCKPQFYYIKVGFKGVKIIQACFRNETHWSQRNYKYNLYYGEVRGDVLRPPHGLIREKDKHSFL